ncbi:MAG: FHA domain-containing protein, partial [Raoultibacter sp.]
NASRSHAELRFEPQGVWSITDLGSTNGTKVNGRIITSQPLYEGDQITIGVTNLVFTQE